MAKAPPDAKVNSLMIIMELDFLPTGDNVMMLGNFNVWRKVRGLHGIGTCNEAGE